MMRAATIAACLVAALSAVPALAQDKPQEVAGRCQYPDAAKEYADETTFIDCNALTVESHPGSVTIAFARKGWGHADRFVGQIDGDSIRVARIALRKGEPRKAEGTCRLTYRADGTLALAKCLAQSRGRWFAANFVASGF